MVSVTATPNIEIHGGSFLIAERTPNEVLLPKILPNNTC